MNNLNIINDAEEAMIKRLSGFEVADIVAMVNSPRAMMSDAYVAQNRNAVQAVAEYLFAAMLQERAMTAATEVEFNILCFSVDYALKCRFGLAAELLNESKNFGITQGGLFAMKLDNPYLPESVTHTLDEEYLNDLVGRLKRFEKDCPNTEMLKLERAFAEVKYLINKHIALWKSRK